MKIVILDGYAANPGDLDYHLLEKLGEVVVYPRTSDAEKVERAKDADIILLNKVQIDAETLAQLPKLKYIGIQATGFQETGHHRNQYSCLQHRQRGADDLCPHPCRNQPRRALYPGEPQRALGLQ